MKGKIFSIAVQLLSVVTFVQAQTYEIRSLNKGNGIIGVEMRVTSGTPPNTSTAVTDLVFGLKWQSAYGVDLVSAINTTYNIRKSDTRKLKGSYYYQAFYADNVPYNLPSNWVLNSWVEIMSIANTRTGTGTGTFQICERNFDVTTDPNIGLNLMDYTPTINDSAENVILPINLLKFDVNANKNYIDLSWSTSTEINNKGFEIQRSVEPQLQFQTIGWVDGKVNSPVIANYNFSDKQVEPGILYFYRLKQMDLDGKASFSSIKQAGLADVDDGGFKITPNPASSFLKIAYQGNALMSNVKIRITDGKGSAITEQSSTFVPGATATLNISTLSAGQYYLVIEQNKNIVRRMLFQKM